MVKNPISIAHLYTQNVHKSLVIPFKKQVMDIIVRTEANNLTNMVITQLMHTTNSDIAQQGLIIMVNPIDDLQDNVSIVRQHTGEELVAVSYITKNYVELITELNTDNKHIVNALFYVRVDSEKGQCTIYDKYLI